MKKIKLTRKSKLIGNYVGIEALEQKYMGKVFSKSDEVKNIDIGDVVHFMGQGYNWKEGDHLIIRMEDICAKEI